jgi:hypothetical protein
MTVSIVSSLPSPKVSLLGARMHACATVQVWDVSFMCTFTLNNLGKVSIIYVVYLLGKMVNLVKL